MMPGGMRMSPRLMASAPDEVSSATLTRRWGSQARLKTVVPVARRAGTYQPFA